MAKGDKNTPDLAGLDQVEVPSPADALAAAVEQGKVAQAGYVTDVTNAKEVSDNNGTTVVRW